MENWHEMLRQSGDDPPIVVAINKIDLLEGAPLTEEEIRTKYGKTFPNMFFVSARTGDSITELFQEVGIRAMDERKTETPRMIDVKRMTTQIQAVPAKWFSLSELNLCQVSFHFEARYELALDWST
jgi:50S ribosomal subunit-associated GTPase HflX